MKYFRFRNWRKYQHYHDRRPPWVKLYIKIIEPGNDLYDLSDQEVGQLAKMWALAGKSDNCLPYNSEVIAEEIHASEPLDLDRFADLGLFDIVEGKTQFALEEQLRKDEAKAKKEAAS